MIEAKIEGNFLKGEYGKHNEWVIEHNGKFNLSPMLARSLNCLQVNFFLISTL